jgi:ferric-dicitrate binding protein FerR (iron transport regulator)
MNKFKLIARNFDPSADKADLDRLSIWLMDNPSGKAELEKIRQIWDDSAQLQAFQNINPDQDWLYVKNRITPSFKTRHKILPLHAYWLRIAVILIVVIGLSVGLYKIFRTVSQVPERLVTLESNDQVESFRLPDGSMISLNINSTVHYKTNFNQESRDIILSGEAFFDVQHNPRLPFRVYTGNSVVEVTGTRFSILEDASFIRVMVLSGSVNLQSAEIPTLNASITQNESGVIYRDNTLNKQKELNMNNISWKTGLLIFDRTPVETALQDIAHHFHKDLVLEASIRDSLTARFSHQSLDDILEELSLLTSLTIKQTEHNIIVKQ